MKPGTPGSNLTGAVTQLVPAATLAALVTSADLGGFKGDDRDWLTLCIKNRNVWKSMEMYHQVGVMDLLTIVDLLI